MSTLLVLGLDENSIVECDNCPWTGLGRDLNPILDAGERLDPEGGIVPAGECPVCGALAYVKEPEKPKEGWTFNGLRLSEMTVVQKFTAIFAILLAIPLLIAVLGIFIIVFVVVTVAMCVGLLLHLVSPNLAHSLGFRFSHKESVTDGKVKQEEFKQSHQEGKESKEETSQGDGQKQSDRESTVQLG